MPTFTLDTVIDAPREMVYDIFADRERNGEFLPVQTRLVTPGTDERQGVGAVHFLGVGAVGVREQITELVPGQRIRYRIVGGIAPVREHTGTIVFSDADAGTRVQYTMASTPALPAPGFAVRLALRALVTAFVTGARKEAKRRTTR